MVFPDARVAEVCRLGPVKAAEVLARGRAGDYQALCDWTVRAAFMSLVAKGVSRSAALRHVRNLLSGVKFKPKLTP